MPLAHVSLPSRRLAFRNKRCLITLHDHVCLPPRHLAFRNKPSLLVGLGPNRSVLNLLRSKTPKAPKSVASTSLFGILLQSKPRLLSSHSTYHHPKSYFDGRPYRLSRCDQNPKRLFRPRTVVTSVFWHPSGGSLRRLQAPRPKAPHAQITNCPPDGSAVIN